MRPFLVDAVNGFNWFVLFHYGLLNLIYTVLLAVSTVVILRHILRIRYAPFRDFVTSPETPLVVKSWVLSALKAMCQTRRPTRM